MLQEDFFGLPLPFLAALFLDCFRLRLAPDLVFDTVFFGEDLAFGESFRLDDPSLSSISFLPEMSGMAL